MHNLSQTFPKPKRTLRTTDASGYRTMQEQENQFPAVCINKRVKKKEPCIIGGESEALGFHQETTEESRNDKIGFV